MKGKFWLMCCLILAVSCKKQTAPTGILSQPEMADWMVKIYLAESRVSTMSIPRDSVYKLFMPYRDSIMKHSNIPDSTLKKSYQYYFAHPVEMEGVYDIIIDSLNLREQRLREAIPR